jgi:tetratricopeptide (TPR) repeat protein
LARNSEYHAARVLLAEVALSQSAPALALEQTRQVLAAEQNNAQAHHLMALALDELGEPAAALKHYERAATLAPGVERYVVAYQSALDSAVLPAGVRGVAPAAITPQGRANSAGPATAQTAAASAGVRQTGYAPGSARANSATQATYAEPADKTDPAVNRQLTDFRARIAHEPDNQQIALSAAVYALRHDRPEVAVELTTAALGRHSESASLFRVLGAAQVQQGNLRAAQVALAKALSLDKRDPLAYFLMGTTLARLGEADAAERSFAEAARLDPRYRQNRN